MVFHGCFNLNSHNNYGGEHIIIFVLCVLLLDEMSVQIFCPLYNQVTFIVILYKSSS